jgi:hypothetical protein
VAAVVIDDLRVNVCGRTEDVQTRASLGT